MQPASAPRHDDTARTEEMILTPELDLCHLFDDLTHTSPYADRGPRSPGYYAKEGLGDAVRQSRALRIGRMAQITMERDPGVSDPNASLTWLLDTLRKSGSLERLSPASHSDKILPVFAEVAAEMMKRMRAPEEGIDQRESLPIWDLIQLCHRMVEDKIGNMRS
jgi:hypothetical protein